MNINIVSFNPLTFDYQTNEIMNEFSLLKEGAKLIVSFPKTEIVPQSSMTILLSDFIPVQKIPIDFPYTYTMDVNKDIPMAELKEILHKLGSPLENFYNSVLNNEKIKVSLQNMANQIYLLSIVNNYG